MDANSNIRQRSNATFKSATVNQIHSFSSTTKLGCFEINELLQNKVILDESGLNGRWTTTSFYICSIKFQTTYMIHDYPEKVLHLHGK